MLNSVVFIGRITREPFFKELEGENAVINFVVAIKRNYKNEKEKYDADFIPCVAWGKKARTYREFLNKGSLISVQGKIQSNQRNQVEVLIENIDFLSDASKTETIPTFVLSNDPLA